MNQIPVIARKISETILVMLLCGAASAQDFMGVSAGYETFPSARLKKPISGFETFEVGTSSWNVGLAYPWAFADGQTMILNKLTYKRLEFAYRNSPVGSGELSQAQSIQLSVFIIDSLTERWSLVAAMTPGLSSDFERRMTMDDFTFQAMLGFIRRYGTTFQLGFGLAYTRDFGPPIPLPFLYLDWKITSELSFVGILPVNFDLRYALHPACDLGMAVRVRGDRYHGNPSKYRVNNPQLEYSEATLSPSARIHLAQWIHLNLEGGVAFYRNFEFLDGDISAASYDLEPGGYLRAEFVLGM